jgi:hypothetical protein
MAGSPVTDLYNSVLEMEQTERIEYVKKLSTDQVLALKELIGLPPKSSIKKLCKEIEDTAVFIRIQNKS